MFAWPLVAQTASVKGKGCSWVQWNVQQSLINRAAAFWVQFGVTLFFKSLRSPIFLFLLSSSIFSTVSSLSPGRHNNGHSTVAYDIHKHTYCNLSCALPLLQTHSICIGRSQNKNLAWQKAHMEWGIKSKSCNVKVGSPDSINQHINVIQRNKKAAF